MFYSLPIYEVFYLITVIGSVTIFLFLLFKGFSDRFQFIYALTNAAVIVWGLGRYALLVVDSPELALMWTHVLYIGSILVHIFFLHAVLVYLGIERKRLVLLNILYVNAAILTAVNFIDLFFGTRIFISEVSQKLFFPYYESPGPFYYSLHLLQYLFIPQYALVEMLLALRREWGNVTRRFQHILVITSSVFGFIGGNTVVPLVFNIPVLPLGVILVPINFVTMTYAILRFHLINFKVIATELLSFAILTTILVETVLSRTIFEATLRAAFFLTVAFFTYLLIQAVNREVELRERVEKQEKELEVANRQQENLLHFISHEVKGYLTESEAGFASVVEGDFGEVSAPLKRMAGMALDRVRKGVATVMDILDASDMRKGTVSYMKTPFDFRTVVEGTLRDLTPAADEKHLVIEAELGRGQYMLSGDEEKMREHVVRNLIDNAIKYTPHGTIDVKLSDGQGRIRFSVKDSGVGITTEDMKLLFTEGGHGKDSIKINVHSTGYGLFIAKQVVEAHGGTIRAESEGQGKGSTFIVELPASP